MGRSITCTSKINYDRSSNNSYNTLIHIMLIQFMLLVVLLSCIFAREVDASSCNVRDYGASGTGVDYDDAAFSAALSECDTILIPSGRYLLHPMNISSNKAIYLRDKDSVVVASDDIDNWPIVDQLPSYYPACKYAGFLGSYQQSNISIYGLGTIDGQGKNWWVRADAGQLNCERPRLIEPLYCNNFSLNGITLINAPFWTVHPYACVGVNIVNIIIDNPVVDAPNTDGIDPDSCSDVYISGCLIKGGDDAIAIKSGKDKYGRTFNVPSKNILIENCIIGPSSGINIGSEMSGDVYNVVVRNTSFVGSLFATRIKSGRGRGGHVYNVTFEDLTLDLLPMGFAISMKYASVADPASPTADTTPHFDNITYRRITGTTFTAGAFECLEESACRGIHFEDVNITSKVAGFECFRVFGTSTGYNYPEPCFHRD